ncbi:MAG: GPI anchored serine-threonine rich family protein [Reichenbachiella sp.]
MKKVLFFLLAITFCQYAVSQNVENAAVQQVGDDLIISFDLMPKESIKERYTISLIALYGNDSIELKVKDGSLTDIRPGNGLQFTVSGKDNLENVKGNVDFSVTARMTYSPIRILTPGDGQSAKRGKSLDVAWKGGFEKDDYSIYLYQSDSLISTLKSPFVGTSYTWNIPKKTKKAENYQIRLTSNNHQGQSEISSEFRIKNKIPIVIKVLPLAVLGGVVAILLTQSDDGGSTEVPDPPALPEL